jgi:hypothetical protein
MPSVLSQVLQAVEAAGEPCTLAQLARQFDLSPAMLEEMLTYWVRKGRLREVDSSPACATCGRGASCPFVAKMPRTYEVVRDDEPPCDTPAPVCRHCG